MISAGAVACVGMTCVSGARNVASRNRSLVVKEARPALCRHALLIRERPATYITQAECYGALPHDLLSLAYYHTGRVKEAAAQAKTALEFSPNDARIAGNLALFEKELERD